MVSSACYFIGTREDAGYRFVDLSAGEEPDPKMVRLAEELVDRATVLVDIALAQQSLMQGDAVLPLIAARLDDADTSALLAAFETEKRNLDVDAETIRSLIQSQRTRESLDSLYGEKESQEKLDEEHKRALSEAKLRFEAGELKQQFDRMQETLRQIESRLMLKDNPILAQNLLIYLLRSEQLVRGDAKWYVNQFTYSFFLQASSPWYLQNTFNCVSNPPTVAKDPDGIWIVVFPCQSTAFLPASGDLAEGQFVRSQEFSNLMTMRIRLAEATALQQVKKQVTPEASAFLDRFLLTAMSE